MRIFLLILIVPFYVTGCIGLEDLGDDLAYAASDSYGADARWVHYERDFVESLEPLNLIASLYPDTSEFLPEEIKDILENSKNESGDLVMPRLDRRQADRVIVDVVHKIHNRSSKFFSPNVKTPKVRIEDHATSIHTDCSTDSIVIPRKKLAQLLAFSILQADEGMWRISDRSTVYATRDFARILSFVIAHEVYHLEFECGRKKSRFDHTEADHFATAVMILTQVQIAPKGQFANSEAATNDYCVSGGLALPASWLDDLVLGIAAAVDWGSGYIDSEAKLILEKPKRASVEKIVKSRMPKLMEQFSEFKLEGEFWSVREIKPPRSGGPLNIRDIEARQVQYAKLFSERDGFNCIVQKVDASR